MTTAPARLRPHATQSLAAAAALILLLTAAPAIGQPADQQAPHEQAPHELLQRALGDNATYEVTFDASWSAATHPVQFPPNPHFSALVGGVHRAAVTFWQPGANASHGIKNMAEQGRTGPLKAEVETAIAAGTASAVILGGGIGRSPGSASATLTVSRDFPLVTLVSMIAPSPDWFVGVHGLSLLDDQDRFVDELTVELLPYDAGTDSGTTFTSPNQPTQPPVPVRRITDTPFADPTPLGTFTFRRTDPVPEPLLLHGGRFQVTARWAADDRQGVGTPVELTDETGYFWFGNQANVEVVVKIVDACDPFGSYWVFAAGLTDLEVLIEVEDTVGEVVLRYMNRENEPFRPIQDTRGFDTCP